MLTIAPKTTITTILLHKIITAKDMWIRNYSLRNIKQKLVKSIIKIITNWEDEYF